MADISAAAEVNPFEDSPEITGLGEGSSQSTLVVHDGVVLTLSPDSVIIHDELILKNQRRSFCGVPLPFRTNPTTTIPFYNILHAEVTSTDLTIHYARQVSRSTVRPAHLSYVLTKAAQTTASSFVAQLLSHAYGSSIRQKRLKVLINPFGGKGKARSLYGTDIEPLLAAARCDIDAVFTEYSGHAADIAEEVDTNAFDAIVCCSGDGVAHEVFNGLGRKRDASRALAQVAVVQLPCGTGNAMSVGLNGTDSPSLATLAIIKGIRTPLDLASVTQGGRRTLSFLSQSFGLVAEADLGTEHLRWMGDTRFYYGFFKHLIRKTVFPCDIAVEVVDDDKQSLKARYMERIDLVKSSLLSPAQNKQRVDSRNSATDPRLTSLSSASDIDLGLPPLHFGTASDPLPSQWTLVPRPTMGNFYVGNMPYMASEANFFPYALPGDGCFDLSITDGTISRMAAIRNLIATGDGTIPELDFVDYRKVRAYRLVPKQTTATMTRLFWRRTRNTTAAGDEESGPAKPDYGEGFISIDGERVAFEPFQVEVHEGLGTVLTRTGRRYEEQVRC